jgi:hypothetical protein
LFFYRYFILPLKVVSSTTTATMGTLTSINPADVMCLCAEVALLCCSDRTRDGGEGHACTRSIESTQKMRVILPLELNHNLLPERFVAQVWASMNLAGFV